MDYITTLYERKKLKHREPQIINVDDNAKVRLNGIMFDTNIISRIKLFKWDRDANEDNDKVSIFVELYIGNLDICTNIFYSDVTITLEKNERNIIEAYEIREARDYDYKIK